MKTACWTDQAYWIQMPISSPISKIKKNLNKLDNKIKAKDKREFNQQKLKNSSYRCYKIIGKDKMMLNLNNSLPCLSMSLEIYKSLIIIKD